MALKITDLKLDPKSLGGSFILTEITPYYSYLNGERIDKAGTSIDVESEIKIKENAIPYVSRGGLKLEKAIKSFSIILHNTIAMDIGASTGGFTDCMLKNGTNKVYAIDVGYGQLDWKLRTDSRVINLEKTNIRYLDNKVVNEKVNFISIDVSFISLKLVFPVASDFLAEDGSLVCLVKPQFEAGREQVGKNGIVRDPKVHSEVISNVISYAKENDLYPHGLDYSPVTGTKGNIEYLLYLKKNTTIKEINVDEVVTSSHENLKKIYNNKLI